MRHRAPWLGLLVGCLTAVVTDAQSTPPPPQTVEAAEAEGAKHPPVTAPGPEATRYTEAFGPRERQCVDVGTHVTARSGDFVAGPFDERSLMVADRKRSRSNTIWWIPRQMPAAPILLIRARRIGAPPDVAASYRFNETRSEVRVGRQPNEWDNPLFFPTELRFPQAGNWLVVVTSGDNWGCFILDEI